MNRFISVPRAMCRGEEIPEKAKHLAKLYSLEIQILDDATDIEIKTLPQNKSFKCLDFYTRGRIWSLDIIDEFQDLSKNCVLFIDGVSHHPIIKETHMLKFRPRINTDGDKQIEVVIGENIIFRKTIEQIK